MTQSALTLPKIQALLTALMTSDKSGNAVYTPSFDNSLLLLNKIGLDVTFPQYIEDRLPELNGDFLANGKTIEEFNQDLVLPTDPDSLTPEEDLKAWIPSARKPYYSYTMTEQLFATTRKYNDLQQGFTSPSQTAKAIADILKTFGDSYYLNRYALKRQMFATLVALVEKSRKVTGGDAVVFAKGTSYLKGQYVVDNATPTKYGMIFNAYTANDATDWNDAVAKGFIVVLDLETIIDAPTDTASGETAIIQMKKDAEIASDNSQGHSLSGNTLGAQKYLRIYVKQGIMPNLDVNTMAGAFHLDKLALPFDIKVLPDFGDADSKVWAILVDTRGVRLHPSLDYVADTRNGAKGWVSYYRHCQYTPFISRNTFVKVYKSN